MDKLKQWLKSLWCKIVGCSFDARNTTSTYDNRTMMCVSRTRCVRCGQRYTIEIPIEDLLNFDLDRL
jgi:hypothetical protein